MANNNVKKCYLLKGKEKVEGAINKFSLNSTPAHQLWEEDPFTPEVIEKLFLNRDDVRISCGKANFHFNNPYYPTVGVWANAHLTFGILFFVSAKRKKLNWQRKKEFQLQIKELENKIREGNFSLICEYCESSAGGQTSYSDDWTKHYVVRDGKPGLVYSSGPNGYSSESLYGGGISTHNWDEEPVGSPITNPDFNVWYGNIRNGCGNADFHHSGNGVRWMELIKKLYPEIEIPGK